MFCFEVALFLYSFELQHNCPPYVFLGLHGKSCSFECCFKGWKILFDILCFVDETFLEDTIFCGG